METIIYILDDMVPYIAYIQIPFISSGPIYYFIYSTFQFLSEPQQQTESYYYFHTKPIGSKAGSV